MSQVGALTKEQVRSFIVKALKEGIFTQFFSKQDKKIEDAVVSLFNHYFQDVFSLSEVPGSIDKTTITNQINIKLANDESLREVLLTEFDKFEPEGTGSVMITEA